MRGGDCRGLFFLAGEFGGAVDLFVGSFEGGQVWSVFFNEAVEAGGSL